VLGTDIAHVKRIVFTEITKPAILTALNSPKDLDMHMVHSQLARQVLDKLIGFKVSPCLWREFKNWKLSAGRVQSVVTKLIIEREQEILAFASANYFKVLAGFFIKPEKLGSTTPPDLPCELETRLTDPDEVSRLLNTTAAGRATYWVDSMGKAKSKRQPSPPYITSSLQQDASNKLGGISPDMTMAAAQKLYEAGLITFMRTDSLMLSVEALGKIESFIKTTYGESYHRRQQYTKKAKGAQEAHEAIRPTDITRQDVSGIAGLTAREIKLYGMIWRRTIASQMSPADIETKTVKIRVEAPAVKPHLFITKHEKVLFDGFLKLYGKAAAASDTATSDTVNEESEDNAGISNKKLEALFDSLKKDQQVWCSEINAEEKQTKPPNGRYTEASLVKKLEDLGIGRPSTYATMVSRVQEKSYVEKRDIPAKDREFRLMSFKYPASLEESTKMVKVDGEKNKLCPSSLGIMITGFLVKHFELFMDYEFTANVENLLDDIAEGKKVWHGVVRGIWNYLNPIIAHFNGEPTPTLTSQQSSTRVLGIHPETGAQVKVIRTRQGWQFLAEDPDGIKQNNRYAELGLINPDAACLDDAVACLVWPKHLGTFNELPVLLNKRKNLYLTYGNKHYNLDNYIKEHDLKNAEHGGISLAMAIEVIEDDQQHGGGPGDNIRFPGADDYIVKKGPYGYYIKYLGSFNIPLPITLKKNIALATKDNCDEVVKTYLQNKGQAKNVSDIKIKAPPATDSSIDAEPVKAVRTKKPSSAAAPKARESKKKAVAGSVATKANGKGKKGKAAE
jgi:DNA topoisomerase-1